eukprot:TRINITY_DN95453_c0_g1_i1.p1 TRINITY_DN95453_c0_g1~~TRINITY_DN95453_c0_g1_i1.p1  ORF type:complete len:123 (+),score=24.31 TRINITY_DN95453_c0_g1_i1:127-495(+)
MFPLKYRARCMGLTTMANWVGNYIVAQFTPVLLEAFGFGTFLLFGICCGISLAVATWLPETKGIPLEHIEELFDRKFAQGCCCIRAENASRPGGDYKSKASKKASKATAEAEVVGLKTAEEL